MFTLAEEAIYFESTDNDLDTIDSLFKLWNKNDTILCLESENNEGIISKIINFIKKIINEAKNMITKGLNSLSNHIRYGLLSKKQKEKFNQFQKFVQENPAVKNKKVTVKDWQRIMSDYDKIEKNLVKYMNDKTVDAKGLNMKANDMLANMSSVLNSATAAITVDMCLVLARKSPEMAEAVQKSLNSSKATLMNIEEQLGEAEVKKLQKKLNQLTKESVFQKIMGAFYQKKEKSLIECVTEVTDTFEKLMSGEATLKDKFKAGVEHRDLVRTGGKTYIRNSRTRKGVKQISEISKKIKEDETVSSVISSVKEFFKPKV